MGSRPPDKKSVRKTKAPKHSIALVMTLKREPFDAIVSGEKKTEYRENKAYWRNRLVGRTYDEVHFRNGYGAKVPFLRVEYRGLWKYGKGRGSYFGIRLGEILELKYYRKKTSAR